MDLAILPLAITMMAGPQILSAIILITRQNEPIKVSFIFVLGIIVATAVGVSVLYFVVNALGYTGSPEGGSRHWLELILVGLLIFLSIRSYLERKTAQPPRWLLGLQTAKGQEIFRIALLLVFLMPTDIIVMLTVAAYLSRSHETPISAIPFLLLTAVIAALPLLAYGIFRRRAAVAMPKVRDWMTANSWLVNIIVYLFFIVIIL